MITPFPVGRGPQTGRLLESSIRILLCCNCTCIHTGIVHEDLTFNWEFPNTHPPTHQRMHALRKPEAVKQVKSELVDCPV